MTKKSKFSVLVLAFLMLGFLFSPIIILAQEGGDAEVQQLSEDIKSKQDKIDELKDKISAYEANLETERSKSRSLQSQIYILEQQIQKKQAEIDLKEQEIEETNLQIQKTEEEITMTLNEVEDKKIKLASFLREIYRQDQKDDLEIVIMNESISDFFHQIQMTEQFQAKLNDNLVDLKDLKISLEEKQTELGTRKESLEELRDDFESKQGALEDQQSTKEFYLTQAKNSENKYQQLVEKLKAEQAQINAEIVSLEKAIRKKLEGSGSKLTDLGDATFIWPVPSQIVTTTFHDPDYPFRNIFEHPAIDVRAGQGTPIKAAASGYVAKVASNGYGYSYIMLVHSDGFSTVYGHVSAIYVETDQFVTQGEIIGKSGGMPGTLGAGSLTTGPHLHFELRKNGIPINPLDYLP